MNFQDDLTNFFTFNLNLYVLEVACYMNNNFSFNQVYLN